MFLKLLSHGCRDIFPGMDKISPRVLQSCGVALTEPLHYASILSVITLCHFPVMPIDHSLLSRILSDTMSKALQMSSR